ncbi:hypothetical protein [Cecembia lonarensis]|uniref:Uncharacterized protein n=1 Tax=Cecembia lonarensis (strain CCUG 58316 / KCTC 22772 / LW9) TaxID=1225176 RepID=K1LFF0_CECL9|nr:hypothetical protein [Cecembia lonarensis]EKB50932.1 hypothetical protein B879_00460 [Cecembia lonarensis LW9]
MVNKLVKVDFFGKMLLRIGIALYMWSVVLLSFKFDKENLWMALLMAYLVVIPGLSLLHYRNAKTGLIGGIGTLLFFLASSIVLIVTDLSANVSWTLIYLHIIKDILLLFGSLILIGESLKEIVKDRITAPFPK